MAEQSQLRGRRFAVEELDNGFLLKITEAGSEKFIGRYAYLSIDDLMAGLREKLSG